MEARNLTVAQCIIGILVGLVALPVLLVPALLVLPFLLPFAVLALPVAYARA